MFPSFFDITKQKDLETLINKNNIHKKEQQTDNHISETNFMQQPSKALKR